jgi:ribonuclease BN (tRNA processing enzyme)
VEGAGRRILLDCGPTSVISLKKLGLETPSLDLVLLSHFHADHVAGVPFLFHDFQHSSLRRSTLLVAGPRGVKQRIESLHRALFTVPRRRRYSVAYRALAAGRPFLPPGLRGVRVLPFEVRHRGAPCFGYRLEILGRSLVYSGDTGWFEGIVRAVRGADLFLCECTHLDEDSPDHLSLRRLLARRRDLGARRILLTHLGPRLAGRRSLRGFEVARDGLLVRV